MKRILSFTLVCFAILGCKKNTENSDVMNKAIVQLCNVDRIGYIPSTTVGWNIKATIDTTHINLLRDSSSKFISLSQGSYNIKNYGNTYYNSDSIIANLSPIYYDSLFNLKAGGIYTLFTTVGIYITPNQAFLKEETDLGVVQPGFSKVRFIMSSPATDNYGPPSYYTPATFTDMHPNIVLFDNKGDTITYGNDRYYLDYLKKAQALDFKIIPSGIYTQANKYNTPSTVTFESGKKYTLMDYYMYRGSQGPQSDQFYLVQHKF